MRVEKEDITLIVVGALFLGILAGIVVPVAFGAAGQVAIIALAAALGLGLLYEVCFRH